MMISENKKVKAVGLISGGLDSLIATLLMKLQNIEVIGLNFKSPFHSLYEKEKAECGLHLYKEQFDININYINFEDDFIDILKKRMDILNQTQQKRIVKLINRIQNLHTL